MVRRAAVLSGLLLALLGFTAPASAQQGPSNCTVTGQNTYVRDVMRDFYLWYQFLPNENPSRYASPEAYLEAVRYRALDSHFSYITSKAANDAFYSDSQFIGLGLSTMTTESEMRVLQVFDESPASEAGFARGDRILEINGLRVSTLIERGLIGGAFGPGEIGVEVRVVFQSRTGEEKGATMTKRPVTIPTVSLTRVFEIDGKTVGYIFFRNFVRPSYDALNDAFAALKEAGATELVLDLRYNGGGLVDVAVHLASLIGGSVTSGNVFAEFRHNDRNTRYDETLRFKEPAEQALGLSRLFVIATRSSASASELVINSLRPFIPVTVIGDRTYGKPVGQYGFDFCEKVLAPVSFKLVNADGQADYFDGIAADCAAPDDIEHDLGAGDEGSLAEALHYIRTGSCSSTTETAKSLRARARERIDRATGWQSLINAH
jgi:carboxyl-terminal processing protease